MMVLLFRMKVAFDVLGEEAGKGNDKAFQALKKGLGVPRLASFVPDALGTAAAQGNKEALDLLLNYQKSGILESSAEFALCIPAKADVGPAVDHFVTWLATIQPWERNGGLIIEATNALASAAARGNQKAKDALQKFAVASAQPNN